MTMFNKDQIFQLLESRDGEALRALWQGRGAVDIAALLDSVEDSARQAAALEEGGFITRRTSPEDKRVLQLYPTEKTLELLPQIRESLRGWEDYLTHGFTEEEVALLEGLLERAHQRAAQWVEAR